MTQHLKGEIYICVYVYMVLYIPYNRNDPNINTSFDTRQSGGHPGSIASRQRLVSGETRCVMENMKYDLASVRKTHDTWNNARYTNQRSHVNAVRHSFFFSLSEGKGTDTRAPVTRFNTLNSHGFLTCATRGDDSTRASHGRDPFI